MPAVRPVHLSVSFLLSRHHSLLYVRRRCRILILLTVL